MPRNRNMMPNTKQTLFSADFINSILPHPTVREITVVPFVGEGSYNAQLYRLHLTHNDEITDKPHTLIVKLPTTNSDLYDNAAVFRPGEREQWFYRYAIQQTPINVPHCYYSAVDELSDSSVLVLEDLAPAQVGSWIEGISADNAALVLNAIAQLHATWWGIDPTSDPDLAPLVGDADSEQGLVDQLYADGWAQFISNPPFPLPDQFIQLGERIVGHVAPIENLLKDSPKTLVHGDLRQGNILFGTVDDQRTCWIIDWEDVIVWNGMLDVAWLLGSCLCIADETDEEQLLRGYYRALCLAGVENYGWEQCFRDYRYGMFNCFIQGLLSAVLPQSPTDYDRNLSRALTERLIALSERLALTDLIPV